MDLNLLLQELANSLSRFKIAPPKEGKLLPQEPGLLIAGIPNNELTQLLASVS